MSSLSNSSLDLVEKFWHRIYELSSRSQGAVRIREFHRATQAILGSRRDVAWQSIASHNDQVLPFRIISVDWQGRLSTFSPEFLGCTTLNTRTLHLVRSAKLMLLRSVPLKLLTRWQHKSGKGCELALKPVSIFLSVEEELLPTSTSKKNLYHQLRQCTAKLPSNCRSRLS